VAVGVVAGVAAVPASAGVRGHGRAHPATWFGSYATFGGEPWAWCVDAGRAAPDPGYAWTPSPVPAPRVSYLLTRYGGDVSDESSAALSYLVHTSPDLPHDPRHPVPSTPPSFSGLDVPRRVAALRADAAAFAGPYSVRVSVDVAPGGASGTVRAVLVSAAGRPVAGWPATVRLEGPVHLVPGGGTSATATTTDGGPAWAFETTGSGRVAATVTVRAPADHVVLHDPGSAGVQRVVTAAPVAEVSGSAAAEVARPFAPRVTTRTSATVASPGSRLSDALTVSVAEGTWPAATPLTVTSTLWGPFPTRPVEADRPPDGAPSVGTVETVVHGPGEWTTPELAVGEPGYYVWTEEVAADDAQTGWRGRFGVAEETTVVPWVPRVTTRASTRSAAVGAVVTDTVVVSGLPAGFGDRPGDETALAVTLFGPFDAPPEDGDCTADAPVAGRQEVVAANGTVVPGPFGPLTAPGWYTFVEHLAASERVVEHTGPCGAPSETVHVTSGVTPPPPPPQESSPPEQPEQPEQPSRPPAPSALPRTGSDPAPLATAGAALLGLGVLLSAGVRRRPARRSPVGWVPARPSGPGASAAAGRRGAPRRPRGG
jgi:hypothetical protein